MPDITMCTGLACSLASTCYRSPQSGTMFSEFRQSWFIEEPYYRGSSKGPTICDYYWKVAKKKKAKTNDQGT